MSSQLPQELYRPIVESVTDRQDLISLLSTSIILKYESERIIYRSIEIRSQARLLHFYEITKSPYLASLVQSLTLWVGNRTTSWSYHDLPWYHLSLALSSLNNLQKLTIDQQGYLSLSAQESFMKLLENGPTFQLRVFYCPFALDHRMVSFLERQPKLEELGWRRRAPFLDSPPPLNPSALQELKCLRSSSEIIRFLGVGPNLTHFCHPYPGVEFLPLLSQNIEVLSMGYAINLDIPPYLPNLRFLECIVGANNEQRFLVSVSGLTKLTKVIIAGMARPVLTREHSIELVQRCFACNPCLQVVDIEVPSLDGENADHLRWERGKPDGTLLPKGLDSTEWRTY